MSKPFLLLLVLVVAAGCQTTPTSTDVIDRAVDALGGETALTSAMTYSYKGRTAITAGTFHQEEPFVLFEKAPGKSYYETPLGSRSLIFATNGEMAWTQNDGALAPYRMPDDEAQGVIRRSVFNRLYSGMEDRGVAVVYLGEQEVPAIDNEIDPEQLAVLAYVYPDDDTLRAHFSLDSGLLRMTARNIQTSIGPTPVQVWFDEYRDVSGLKVSHRQLTLFPGEKHVTQIDTVAINEPIPDAVFELAPTPILPRKKLEMLTGRYVFEDGLSVDVSIGQMGLQIVRSTSEATLQTTVVNDTLFLVGAGYEMHNLEFAKPVNGKSPSLRISKGEDGTVGFRVD